MKPRPPRAMIDRSPQSASLSAAQTARGWFGHRSVARAVTGSAPAARSPGTRLAIVLAGIRLGRAWRAVAWCTRRRYRPRAVSWLARPRCGNRGLSAGDRGRHRGPDLVIINGVGDRYDAFLAAPAVPQVGGGAVEDGSGLAGGGT